MKCTLCKKTIGRYNPDFHHFIIDETRSADVCGDCTDEFMKWQGKKMAVLFPTAVMKKRFGKTKGRKHGV
jgi:hypothetical protein